MRFLIFQIFYLLQLWEEDKFPINTKKIDFQKSFEACSTLIKV